MNSKELNRWLRIKTVVQTNSARGILVIEYEQLEFIRVRLHKLISGSQDSKMPHASQRIDKIFSTDYDKTSAKSLILALLCFRLCLKPRVEIINFMWRDCNHH